MNTPSLQQRIVRQFGKPAGMPGRLAGWIMARRPSNRERSLRTLQHLGVETTDRVLEIGYGPGVAIGEAARLANLGHVAGIDHSELMFEVASRRNAAAIEAGRVELHVASPSSMPSFAQPFDKAFAVNVHMFWQDRIDPLHKILLALREGGVLALSFQPRKPGATDADSVAAGESIVEAMQAAGFDEPEVTVFEMKPVSTVCVTGRRPKTGG